MCASIRTKEILSIHHINFRPTLTSITYASGKTLNICIVMNGKIRITIRSIRSTHFLSCPWLLVIVSGSHSNLHALGSSPDDLEPNSITTRAERRVTSAVGGLRRNLCPGAVYIPRPCSRQRRRLLAPGTPATLVPVHGLIVHVRGPSVAMVLTKVRLFYPLGHVQ